MNTRGALVNRMNPGFAVKLFDRKISSVARSAQNLHGRACGQANVATHRLIGQNLPDALSDDDQNFYNGKRMTARYFFEYELVKVRSLAKRLQSTNHVTVEMREEWF